jgi:hypothetical protein
MIGFDLNSNFYLAWQINQKCIPILPSCGTKNKQTDPMILKFPNAMSGDKAISFCT